MKKNRKDLSGVFHDPINLKVDKVFNNLNIIPEEGEFTNHQMLNAAKKNTCSLLEVIYSLMIDESRQMKRRKNIFGFFHTKNKSSLFNFKNVNFPKPIITKFEKMDEMNK